jgi:hypothetical protein
MAEGLDLEPIKARCAAATPGGWRATRDALLMGGGDGPLVPVDGWPRADREFVAHARDDVPALVAEVERLRVDVDRLRTDLDDVWQAHAAACAHLDDVQQATATLRAEKADLRAALQVIRDYIEMTWATFDQHHPGLVQPGSQGPRFNIAAYAATALANGQNGHPLQLGPMLSAGARSLQDWHAEAPPD